jgi:hypothetical protein
LNDYTNRKRFAQWTLNTKTVQLRLLPVQLPPCAYKREVTPLQRVTTETTITTYEIAPDSKALRHRSLLHPDLRCYEATLRILETTFSPMRASLDPYSLRRSSSSRYDQVVQRLSTTMKTVAKGILKDHLVPVASSTTCSGNLNGFNNAGYKATFHPLKMQVPLYRVYLVYPYEMHEKTAERCHPNSLGCVVSSYSWDKHAVLGTKSSFEIL